MKTLSAQLAVFLENREIRQNLPLLLKFVGLLTVVIAAFTVGFHVLMDYEGEDHSWITGLYWTLTVMSTLGFGDITFESDAGRLFSVVVLLTGIIMLLVVLPFAFIRFFYAPWLDAQLKSRAPTELPPDTTGHVLICARNSVSEALVTWLSSAEIPYAVIEPDRAAATDDHLDGHSVIVGDIDRSRTYLRARASQARLVIANLDDVANTNVVLTVREVAPDVQLAAIASDDNAVDVLELSGADRVLPLKRWLGEQLANRVDAAQTTLHTIGEYDRLKIVELPVMGTTLIGTTIRESKLRQERGVNVIGVWVKGKFQAAGPDVSLSPSSVLVIMGTDEQLASLDDLFTPYRGEPHPILVIGGGKVGEAALEALARKGVPAHLVERNATRCEALARSCDATFVGDAARYDLLEAAGIRRASSVLLTTNDDAMNIFLASYCRRLNPDVRIVSRLTSERNIDAIHRAGADFVLSYATLAVNAIASVLHGRALTVLGEGIDLFPFPATASLYGLTLSDSGIGAQTGMSVVAIRTRDRTLTEFPPNFRFAPGMELLLVGTMKQFDTLHDMYP